MRIKIFSSDDVEVLEQVVNAYLQIHDDAEIHFGMAAPNEEDSEPGVRPKTGGPFIEYGICVVLDRKTAR